MARTTLFSSEVVLLVFRFGSQLCNIIPGGECVCIRKQLVLPLEVKDGMSMNPASYMSLIDLFGRLKRCDICQNTLVLICC